MITINLVQNLAAKLLFITILGKTLESSIRNTILANERIEILIKLEHWRIKCIFRYKKNTSVHNLEL